MGALNAYRLFHTVTVDIVGPFQFYENKYFVLTVVDHFSKWAEAAILKEHKAETILKGFILCWVQRYGVPVRILSDRGTDFTKAFNLGTAKRLGLQYIRTSPNYPQGNGVNEGFNKHLKTCIPKIISTFDTVVAMSMMNHRATPHTTTGETPFRLLTGCEFRLPRDISVGVEDASPDLRCRPRLLDLLRDEMQQQLIVRQAHLPQETRGDTDELAVGDLIFVKLNPHQLRKRQNIITGQQGGPVWSLPQRIKEVINDGTQMVVQEVYKTKCSTVSKNNVRKFYGEVESEEYERSMRTERQDARRSGIN